MSETTISTVGWSCSADESGVLEVFLEHGWFFWGVRGPSLPVAFEAQTLLFIAFL